MSDGYSMPGTCIENDTCGSRHPRWLTVIVTVLLALATLAAYWQVRNFDFVNYDDNIYVYENPHIQGGLTLESIKWAFTAGYASFWHPLTWLSIMLDHQLFGNAPGWMHLTNALLHLASTLLLFAALQKMTDSLWPSAFVAAAFSLHPMHVESVAWIAERKDVLSTFFMMSTLLIYAGYGRHGGGIRYLLTLVLFVLGLMAKPMLMTLPFVLLLLDYWPLERLKTRQAAYRAVVEKLPFFVLAGIFGVIALLTQTAGGSVDITSLPMKERIGNVFFSYATYIVKMLWPQNLAVFYPFDYTVLRTWQIVLYALPLTAISVLAIYAGRSRKYLPVGWFWFIGTLVPVIGIIRFTASSYADRFTYVPFVGLFMIIAWGLPDILRRIPHRNVVLGSLMSVVLMLLVIMAHRQVSYWRNSVTLFSHAIDATHNNALAYQNRAFAYRDLGLWQKALDDFGQAIDAQPANADAYNNRGMVLGVLERWPQAAEDYSRAISIKPRHTEAYANLGIAYSRLGRRQEAIEAFEQAIAIKPDSAKTRYLFAGVLTSSGRCDEALEQYREALRLEPEWPECMNELAFMIAANPALRNRDTSEAVSLASRACKLTDNKNPYLVDTLAVAYASAGRFAEAISMADKAMQLAEAAKLPDVKADIQLHRSFYIQGKPYIESRCTSESLSHRP